MGRSSGGMVCVCVCVNVKDLDHFWNEQTGLDYYKYYKYNVDFIPWSAEAATANIQGDNVAAFSTRHIFVIILLLKIKLPFVETVPGLSLDSY